MGERMVKTFKIVKIKRWSSNTSYNIPVRYSYVAKRG